MKISEHWLREYVDPARDSAALAEQLTLQGLEVDDLTPVAPPLEQVVVGRVVTVDPHPDADRLRVCRVDTGSDTLQIVCGAPNVAAGRLYPVALVGAKLPGGLTIRAAKLRGVASAGMLCSATELGLAESADGLLELDGDAAVGQPVTAALDLDDQVIDINITPNRADCFSVVGLARDLGAVGDAPFRQAVIPAVAAQSTETFPVTLEEGAGCPLFAGRVIRDLRTDAVTPLWMRERLRRSGIRPIHPVVDVTNYVMLELGQPMHAYDLDRLQGGLSVRRARAGETLELLTGAEQSLDGDVLVIADANGPVGIAGIMGGGTTGVSGATRNILFESAFFEPGVIAGRARRFGLQTDASMRFERGVDPAGQATAIERATALLAEIAGGTAGPTVLSGVEPPPRPPVQVRRQRLADLLGVELDDGVAEGVFTRLGIHVEHTDDGWRLTPPSFRFDLAIEVDFIEEVARIHGYANIPARAGQQATTLGTVPGDRVPVERAALTLVERGYQEAVTYSFTDPVLDRRLAGGRDGAALLNPISSDLGVMRQSLWSGLLLALRHNLARQQRRIRLFESGVRFIPQGSDVEEKNTLAGVATGDREPEQWGSAETPLDFFDIKADVEAVLALAGSSVSFDFTAGSHPALQPGRTARIERDGLPVGWLGVLHPALTSDLDLPAQPLLFELDAVSTLRAARPAYRAVSRFPAVRRDLAVLVDEAVPVSELRAAVQAAAGDVLEELRIFDVYAGPGIEAGQKSVALGLILQETSRTLTDADTDRVIGAVVARLASDFRARIRE